MGFMDELKKLTHPYSEPEEDDYDDYDDEPLDNDPAPAPHHLRDKQAVVLNLESTNKDVARRLVDFLSGCAYALDGKIKKIAISTYLITPYNVDVVGDLVEELENNGMYF